jgi:hypothetical protein
MEGALARARFLVVASFVIQTAVGIRIQHSEVSDESLSPSNQLKDISDSFVALAASQSYAVKEGIMHNFGLQDCNELTNNDMTCFANNPSSPYGVVMVPPPQAESEDWSLCGTEWMPLCKQNRAGERVSVPWHMKETEAIVVLGNTPPEVKYFGFVNYLYAHTFPENFEINSSVATLSRCWDKGSADRQCDVFASLGDALNHGNIKTRSNASGVYDQQMAMVISPSQTVYEEVKEMLLQAGMGVVNPLPLPGTFLNLGFSSGADTVANLLRTAFPADQDAYDKWIAGEWFVHRLTPQKNVEAPRLYPKPGFCSKRSGIPPNKYCLTKRSVTDEASRVGMQLESLEAAQSLILDKVSDRMGTWNLTKWLRTSKSGFRSGVPDNGYLCLERGQKCQGDSRDTYYPASTEMIFNALKKGVIASKIREKVGLRPLTKQEMADWKFLGMPSLVPNQHKKATLLDSNDEAMVVVGVVHSATKSSQYSSLSIYDLWKLQGIMAIADIELVGSADEYLKGTEYESLSPYLYAVEFTRGHCDGKRFCYDIPSSGELSIPLETPLLFIERMYYDPQTHIGLDATAAVAAQMVHMA